MSSFALLLLLILAQAPPPAVPDDVGTVRALYANAAYEEALAHIGRLDALQMTPQLEQYRALCLMALGRHEEGTLAFERLVRQAPLYVIPESEISPRMFSVFRDVRERVLPLVVREMYSRGKTSFDERRYEAAAAELTDVAGVLRDLDTIGDAQAFADLRQLADGFLRLAEAEMALAARVAAEPPPAPAPAPPAAVDPPAESPAPPAATRAGDVTVERIVVYSRDDRDVAAPREIARFMPPWDPPAVMVRYLEYRGELEVVVGEDGRVEEARMVRRTIPSYDVSLLGATEQWRFEPARRGGKPVKYRLNFEIVLAPRQ